MKNKNRKKKRVESRILTMLTVHIYYQKKFQLNAVMN